MDKFSRLASSLSSSLSSSVSSTVFSTVSAVSNVLPGNPVNREFEAVEHIASAGPGLVWKVYSGYKKSTKQPAAIFVLEKRALEQRFDRQERDYVLDLYRKAIPQLTRLRHPQILTVQHPLEESRDCLAFATEPVYASLANVLGRHENMPTPVPAHIRDYKLFDVEIKYGLLQLSEGLTFLHESVKMVHRNISPESIIINHQGAWKISCFDFCLPNMSPSNQPPSWKFPEYIHGTPQEGYPDLDFLAPEYALTGECGPAADLYSLGMIAFTLYNTKPLFTNSGNWGIYKKNAAELRSLRESNLQLLPSELREYIKMLLNVTPDLRPDAQQFSKIGFFEDIGVKTLNNLDSQFQWDNLQKSQFYKGLPTIIPKLPHRVALHRVVPCLAKEFVNSQMVPFVLPAVLQVAEEATKQDFTQHILPELKPVMKLTEPIQILLIFMQRMELLLSKTPPTDVKSDVLPMVYRALESEASQIQELCLSIIPGFAGLLDYQAMKNAVLPRVKKLCVSTTLLSVRVNSLICLGKLINNLDKWLVIDEILPMLQQIPSREPAVIMGIIGIYKMAMDNEKLGLTKEVMATKALPFLFPLSIENGLTLAQYSATMNLIRQMITKVEEEHKVKLEQLNSIQDEQRSALQISMSDGNTLRPDQLVSAPSKVNETDDLFSGLGLGAYVQKKDTGAIATGMMNRNEQPSVPVAAAQSNKSPERNGLSLEEKRRIMNQGEQLQKLNREQPILVQKSPTPVKATTPKDLTATLMEKNLSNMARPTESNMFSAPNVVSSMVPSITSPMGNFSMAPTLGSAMTMPSSQSMGSLQGTQSSTGWTAFSIAQASPQQPANSRLTKPDLSAFDSLLTMPSNQKKPMSSMTHVQQSTGVTNSSKFRMPQNSPMTMQQQPQTNSVKPLSSNDINDLLS